MYAQCDIDHCGKSPGKCACNAVILAKAWRRRYVPSVAALSSLSRVTWRRSQCESTTYQPALLRRPGRCQVVSGFPIRLSEHRPRRRGLAHQDVFEALDPAALSEVRALNPGGTRAHRLPHGSPALTSCPATTHHPAASSPSFRICPGGRGSTLRRISSFASQVPMIRLVRTTTAHGPRVHSITDLFLDHPQSLPHSPLPHCNPPQPAAPVSPPCAHPRHAAHRVDAAAPPRPSASLRHSATPPLRHSTTQPLNHSTNLSNHCFLH